MFQGKFNSRCPDTGTVVDMHHSGGRYQPPLHHRLEPFWAAFPDIAGTAFSVQVTTEAAFDPQGMRMRPT